MQSLNEAVDMERCRWEVALEVGEAMSAVVDEDTSQERVERILLGLLIERAAWERRMVREQQWLRERAEAALLDRYGSVP